MSWVSLAILSSSREAETLSDALFELGALSVSIEDAHAGTDQEQPLFNEPGEAVDTLWHDSRVVALLPEDSEPTEWLAALQEGLGWAELPPYTAEVVAEQDWVRLTQSQFDPIRISDRLWITPTWHDAPGEGTVNLWLDPGLAFGTGSHPTTRLCLEWLDRHLPKGVTVLDYGCGSGILAIAAKKLGAGPVVGVDIDPQAMQASHDNASQNQVEVAFYLPDAAPVGTYDVVVANILTNPLRTLAPLLAGSVKPGGHIVLSGILVEQVSLVQEAYAPWFDLELADSREGWACLSAVRVR
ncbi:50S ribosomal protein L11 methyltransferase [Leeia oryzae]|uniref:50S ribosomal protein L11 methyltransferase n=1 Tax=Leeia oryzae TaxID=356662 RepID=UPI00039DEDEA|nr:50S ribosomal protein L11 methyltransferase [Leeia oryzae]